MQIAWIIAGDEGGGVAQAVRGLTKAVPARGITPLFISLAEGPFVEELRARGNAVAVLGDFHMPSLTGPKACKLWQIPAMLRESRFIRPLLASEAARQHVQAIHVLWPNLVPLAATTAVRMGIPCFWELPNVLGKYPLGANRRAVQYYLKRFRVTPLAHSRFTAATLGDRPVRPVVMQLGGDATRFTPSHPDAISRSRLGVSADAVVFGIAARLVPEKGQLRFLQALATLGQEVPLTHLALIGGPSEGTYPDAIRAAAGVGVAGRVHILGPVPDPERYYGIVDVAVNAYEGAESFGLSVVEAMLCGKPVLAHALGGPAETVVDGVTGWHVQRPTVVGFREGVLRALADRHRWAEMGAAGRERALKYFSLPVQAARYAEIVGEILRTTRSP